MGNDGENTNENNWLTRKYKEAIYRIDRVRHPEKYEAIQLARAFTISEKQ